MTKEANELERLCDLGASELLMPTSAFQAAAGSVGFSLSSVPTLMQLFGSSFEATAFRLASAHPKTAIAGLLRYRLRVGEQRQKRASSQTQLFVIDSKADDTEPQPKYRRQSIHLSELCQDSYTVRWNKSFPVESIVYGAATNDGVQVGQEPLPNGLLKTGRLEAVRAPYQRDDADAVFGDVLFLWSS